MTEKTDILVIGATGYTGAYIVRYLVAHPQRSRFTLALGARSTEKLQKLADDLKLSKDVKLVKLDVTKQEDIDAAVATTRVVINAVGPYWTWGTPVVRSCVQHGVHYVDITGERSWIKRIINEFDYLATKTGAIIVPSCGFDSVPSDISAYLANKTLKALGPDASGEYLSIADCTSAVVVKGGVSGGTIASAITAMEQVPRRFSRESMRPYSLSPFQGIRRPSFRSVYSLFVPGEKPIRGGLWFMAASNRGIVERTFGLFQTQGKPKDAYGPNFCYDEFQVTRGVVSAFFLTASLVFGFSMMLIKPIRSLVKRYLPQSGDGPTDEQMQKGFFKITNLATSTSSPPVQVKTVLKGQGDPGYLLTPSAHSLYDFLCVMAELTRTLRATVMITESALCLLLPLASERKTRTQTDYIQALPEFAHKGGILTPMTAFGDALIQRLEESGRFEFSSTVVGDASARKNI
ncbi:hypothetical protein D9619_001578 [Psilocybe cf. subviscida]|uniref:Saccharopine dehydrogenase NADP binding domain-containing protein n=1 Tax=Psilocybe cf. subviscida TaxID=2480587 RepID=A0A8H5F354_9AGAR|nr:hypothetical protein D9619_001578 [Psilocybe cf. subviscida]